MPNANIDRLRAQSLMQASCLDALILFQPENIAYATGVGPGVAGLFRRLGAASALVPADPDQSLAAVMPDLAEAAVRAGSSVVDVAFHRIWVDTAIVAAHRPETPLAELLAGRGDALPRPATFDARAALALLHDQLRTRALDRARLGVDLAFVPARDAALLAERLPGAEIVDATETIGRLKMVKTPQEVDRLRAALRLSELGLEKALAMVRPGIEQTTLSAAYTDAVRHAARASNVEMTGVWDYISVGPDPWGRGKPAAAGDILKFDVGVLVAGYSSDMARTMSLGSPSRAARELHAALFAGLDEGLARLRPGVRLGDIHSAMLTTIRANGVPGYTRGHFGHSLGIDVFSEQWPFIAADGDVVVEPGMVLAVEAPLYVDGLGGFIIEDQVLVTAEGIEVISRLDRGLRVLG